MRKKGQKLGIVCMSVFLLLFYKGEEGENLLGNKRLTFEPLHSIIQQQKQTASAKEREIRRKDKAYKLFYGEWEVTRIVSENSKWGAEEGYEELIGQTIYYEENRVENNGHTYSYCPIYEISILPNTGGVYIENQKSVKELGIKGNYYVFVQIEEEWEESSESYRYIGKEFFIKDDETLLMFEKDCLYELKRISWIDDVEKKLRYQER